MSPRFGSQAKSRLFRSRETSIDRRRPLHESPHLTTNRESNPHSTNHLARLDGARIGVLQESSIRDGLREQFEGTGLRLH